MRPFFYGIAWQSRAKCSSYQGMPSGIPQVAENGSGFRRRWQRRRSVEINSSYRTE